MTSSRTTTITRFIMLAVAGLALTIPRPTEARNGIRSALPNDHHMAMLVHSAVAALDQANVTGNYTVLRALSSPAFQRANDQPRLAAIFARLRAQNISLAPALLYDPMLSQPAAIDRNGHLRLIGFFPTSPLRVHFDLLFERVADQWLLFGISIQPRRERQARAG